MTHWEIYFSHDTSKEGNTSMISLKTIITCLLAGILLLGLLVNMGIQLFHAGPRVQAEAGNNLTLAREYVLNISGTIPSEPDPLHSLRTHVLALGKLRHIDIRIVGLDATAHELSPGSSTDLPTTMPKWFILINRVEPKTIVMPLVLNNVRYGTVLIISKPQDELEEIWSDLSSGAAINLFILLPILILIPFLVERLLSPFDGLLDSLSKLQNGLWTTRVNLNGASEFQKIGISFNHLAQELETKNSEKRFLVNQLIDLQESERRELARDLHDEAGPCLFSIRAAASSLHGEINGLCNYNNSIEKYINIIEESCNTLQIIIRGLLRQLKPHGLEELGLEAALRSLITYWHTSYPGVDIRLLVDKNVADKVNSHISSTIYRIVQESLTNIHRHSHASSATVYLSINFEDQSHDVNNQNKKHKQVVKIIVEDNGVGIPERPHQGIGLFGMRERVDTLGGNFEVFNRSTGGTVIRAHIPIDITVDPA